MPLFKRSKLPQTIIAGAFAFGLSGSFAKAAEIFKRDIEAGATQSFHGAFILTGKIGDGARVKAPDDELVVTGKVGKDVTFTAKSLSLNFSSVGTRDVQASDNAVIERANGFIHIAAKNKKSMNQRVGDSMVYFAEPVVVTIKRKDSDAAMAPDDNRFAAAPK